MPTRLIREGINDSLRVNALSEPAELFYRKLMGLVDDFGRYEAEPVLLRAKLYGLREERTAAHVAKFLKEVSSGEKPLVIVYEVNGKKYLQIQDFGQRARTPKFPGPPQVAAKCGKVRQKSASRARTHTPPTPTSPPAQSESPASQASKQVEAAAPPDPPFPISNFPETNAEINRPPFAGTGPEVTAAVVQAAQTVEPEASDSAIALAVRCTRFAKQKSPWAFVKTVPKYLRATPEELRGVVGVPLGRASPVVVDFVEARRQASNREFELRMRERLEADEKRKIQSTGS